MSHAISNAHGCRRKQAGSLVNTCKLCLAINESLRIAKFSVRERGRRGERAVGALVHAHAAPPKPARHVEGGMQHRAHVARAAQRLQQRQDDAQQVPARDPGLSDASVKGGVQHQAHIARAAQRLQRRQDDAEQVPARDPGFVKSTFNTK